MGMCYLEEEDFIPDPDTNRLNALEKELTLDKGFKLLMFLECVGGSLRDFADQLLKDEGESNANEEK